MPKTPAHPAGKSISRRRILDSIGTGDPSPRMTEAQRDVMLDAGLILQLPNRIAGKWPFHYPVAQFAMPVDVHERWCDAREAHVRELAHG